nr:MAG TPA: hypothetical protein [Microviridae sp.]
MAATKFSVVKENKKTGELLIINYAGEWTYKTALAIAQEANRVFNEEGWVIVCVVETKKLYPNENEKKTNKNNLDSE